jgi:hypothetical protein
MALQPIIGPWPLFKFLDPIQTVGLLGRKDQTDAGQTSMTRVGFESTISAFQRAKTVYASDRSGTLMGYIESERSSKL